MDLRYNGGGLIDTAGLQNDLLGGGRRTSEVQMRFEHSPRKSGENSTRNFNPTPQSVLGTLANRAVTATALGTPTPAQSSIMVC